MDGRNSVALYMLDGGTLRAVGGLNGIATTDASGTLTVAQIPASIVSGMTYQEPWNAATNTPTLPPVSTPAVGAFWPVSVAGSTALPGAAGPWTTAQAAIFNGIDWDVATYIQLAIGQIVASGAAGNVLYLDGSKLLQSAAPGATSGVQAYSTILAALVANGSPGAFGLSMLLAALASDARTLLELGTLATLSAVGTAQLTDANVTLAKLANVATATLLGRTTAGTGVPEALTATQATALLNAVAGDSGSGGTKGLVPAPGAGDAAAGKVLGADGIFGLVTKTGTISSGTWQGTAVGTAYGGTGASTASAALANLTPYTSSSSATPTLATTAVDFGLSNAAPTVTLQAISAYGGTGYQCTIRNVSGSTQTVSLDPDGTEVVNQGGAGAVVSFTLLANAVLGLKIVSSTAWSVALLSGNVQTTAYEIRLTGGSWFAYPQGWTGTSWVDVGAGLTLTVEAAGSFTTSGATITVPSGTASNTTPAVTSSYRAYIALSSLSFWSTTYGSQYAVDLSCSFGSTVANARFGYALCFPTGAYDANAETLFSERMGYTGANYTTQVSQGTGTYSQAYLGAAVPTLSRVAFFPGLANAVQVANGTAPDGGAMTIPVTLPTHLYVLGGAATGATGSSLVVTPSVRLIRLDG